MKVVIFHPHFAYPRGASKFVIEVAERLVRSELEVLIVTIMADRKTIEEHPVIKFHCLGGPKTDSLLYWFTFPLFQWKLHRYLNTIPNKVLFPQVMPANWWAMIYKKFHRQTFLVWMCQEPSAFVHSLPVIESLRQPFPFIIKIFRPILVKFDKWLVSSADIIIANSKYGSYLIESVYNRKPDDIAYPGVDTNKFKPGEKKEDYIITVSRFDKQKRIDILIKAYSMLPIKLQKKYALKIAGEGQEKQRMMDLVKRLGLSDRVNFLGHVADEVLPEIYAKASLVIFPAVGEPFGIVPLEAMACGTPVIACRGGGTEETILEGKTGFLVKPNNAEALKNKIIYLLKHEDLLLKMTGKSRQYVENNFSWEKTANVLAKFLTLGFKD